MAEDVAVRCCHPDEVYLCGKRKRTAYGTTEACSHFDKDEARRHQRIDDRKSYPLKRSNANG